MNVPFQAGYQKITLRGEKRYCPYLYRFGQRRYSGKGRGYFRTASEALIYATSWSKRASRLLNVKLANQIKGLAKTLHEAAAKGESHVD